ncbi:class I SAM-dependent methyltransferase [Candidatus Poribacteria bacterium]|jgi:tRNA (cmo5U34)-methyltransferase|nr:class I SAM-dependent methyltransferase [Candidatus Poribacteria bacterium]MBT5537258.1 class I SAM-dependent methyltransferase [Candidatus Poribacteria bacterium]MBT7101734.1 class I SAM-dependent methyltransferase [Candidatus Poribacteria bacterium]MBT7807497.1 class I SAM-dependent methyltransferase [Candidatus Poribacteria bacterium]
MRGAGRQQVDEEFERIRGACTRGAAPKGGSFPEWTRDGIESLEEFFDGTAHLWDARFGAGYEFLHAATADQIPSTDDAITILDVGCGTGLELEFIFERAPHARITCLDQAPRMLDEVRRKYADRRDQISLVEASCLDWPPGLSGFDFALSILCLHHFPPDTKPRIYSSIRGSLRDTGVYIEGDQMVLPEAEAEGLALFEAWIAKLPSGRLGAWNYDISLSVETTRRLLLDAGFSSCEQVYDDNDDGTNRHAVLVAR